MTRGGIRRPVHQREITVAAVLWMIVVAAVSGAAEQRESEAPFRAVLLGNDIDVVALRDPLTPARVRLGRFLFFERRLSADRTIACATCHRPEYAFSELKPVSS